MQHENVLEEVAAPT